MRTVPFEGTQHAIQPLQFLDTVPAVYAAPLLPPDQVLRLWIHYVDGISLPCTGDDCENCHIGKRPYGYTLVLANPVTFVAGRPACVKILGIPFLSFEFWEKDRRGRILEIGRKNNSRSGQLVVKDCGGIKIPELPLPSLEGSLHRLWSKRCERISPADEWDHVGTGK